MEVDSFGNLTLKGAEGKDDVDQVHLEAVDDEIFKRLREERAQERRLKDVSADAGATEDQGAAEQLEEESTIRIVLKAKDRKDSKLIVKPVSHLPSHPSG